MGKRSKNKKPSKSEAKVQKVEMKRANKLKKMLDRLKERDITETIKELEAQQAAITHVTEENCGPPPLSAFSLVAHPREEQLILFGGELFDGIGMTVYNGMYFYNIPTNKWTRLITPCGPTPRSGHRMVAVDTPDGGELWLFGGDHTSISQVQYYHYNDLWVFHLKSRVWEKVNAPNAPSARSGHRMVLHNRCLMVFGGFFDTYFDHDYYNDLHAFDLDKREWLQLKIGGFVKPAPRSGCCFTVCPDGKLLVYGGVTKNKGSSVKKSIITHTYRDMFSITQDPTDPLQWKWLPVIPGGYYKQMVNLASLSCTLPFNGEMYCFGGSCDSDFGEDIESGFSNEMYILNLTTLEWRKSNISEIEDLTMEVEEIEDAPIEVEQNKDLHTTNVFLLPKDTDKAPHPRMGAGLCILKNVLYLYGGLYEVKNRVFTFNDFYSLDLLTMKKWQKIRDNSHDLYWKGCSDDEEDEEDVNEEDNKMDDDTKSDEDESDDDDDSDSDENDLL